MQSPRTIKFPVMVTLQSQLNVFHKYCQYLILEISITANESTLYIQRYKYHVNTNTQILYGRIH